MTMAAQSPPPRRVKQQSQDLAKMYNIKMVIALKKKIPAILRIRLKASQAIRMIKVTAAASAEPRTSICTRVAPVDKKKGAT